MNLKDMECSKINIFDTETGSNLLSINNVKSINMTLEPQIDYAKKDSKNILSFERNITHTINFDTEKPINTEEFYKLFGVDKSNCSDAYNIQFIKIVQVRKHKKKRINKKWAKRYGYKQITIDDKRYEIKSDTNGNFTFIK